MNIIFSTIIALMIVLLFTILAAWLDRSGQKDKEEFIDKAIEKVLDKVSATVTSVITMAKDLDKIGPWYLVVYTKDSNYPIWVSNNNIRSVHPDPQNRKIIIKQFCNEDMVIENVDNYEMCSANDMCDYDM